ncbi:hypothetical protein C9374_010391 [Naegleria lovaniensis]|uniref:Uncharacterized protein n=1 Tax=Naegleria lovaniensis TaxID=51637 RepID=A0AA88GCE2_NAELO|nr:uncharacterized protein C9374_010391 [Naegleria lovaniensis]KAG2375017.1 hypothetical protein C9374_010391 [Naegleria lovaniensis]
MKKNSINQHVSSSTKTLRRTKVTSNEVFISDEQNRINKILTNGTWLTVVGQPSGSLNGFGGDGYPSNWLQVLISHPQSVHLLESSFPWLQNMLFVDAGNYRVRKVHNGIISTVADNGIYPLSEDDVKNGVPAVNTSFSSPLSVFERQNEIYISDTFEGIRKVLVNGTIVAVCPKYRPECTVGYNGGLWVASNGDVFFEGRGQINKLDVATRVPIYVHMAQGGGVGALLYIATLNDFVKVSYEDGKVSQAVPGMEYPPPSSMFVTSQGEVYMTVHHTIQKFNNKTGQYTIIKDEQIRGCWGKWLPSPSAKLLSKASAARTGLKQMITLLKQETTIKQ